MSEVIGDTSHLHRNTVPFSAVIELRGASGAIAAPLCSATGFKHLLAARASVEIVSGSLTCRVVGPVSPTKALTAIVAIVPEDASSEYPTTASQTLTVGGNAFAQHSLFVRPESVPLDFAPEVAHQLKPKPLVGLPPYVVGHFTLNGHTEGDVSRLVISGRLAVDGVGFAKSW